MEKNVGSRIKKLRTYYRLGIKEFGLRCGLSHVAIFHLENGKTSKPQHSSLQKMVECYGTTYEWLRYGIGNMLPSGRQVLNETALKQENIIWKNEAYLELKNKNELLEKEVGRLWQMVNRLTQHEELTSVMKNESPFN
jgi:transcriptional regulator with XRE-family HTH domain